MISRITIGGLIAWLHDRFHQYGDYGKTIDQHAQTIDDLRSENAGLRRQVERIQNELTETKANYEFYFDAYIRGVQRDQDTKRR